METAYTTVVAAFSKFIDTVHASLGHYSIELIFMSKLLHSQLKKFKLRLKVKARKAFVSAVKRAELNKSNALLIKPMPMNNAMPE